MLASVPEFREARGRVYNLAFILAVCLVAVLGGAKNYREISTIVAEIPQWMLRLVGAEWNYFTLRYEHPRKTTMAYPVMRRRRGTGRGVGEVASCAGDDRPPG